VSSSVPSAHYTFLPWLRQGVAGGIEMEDPLGAGPSGQGERARIRYDVFVNGARVSKDVHLMGPGDITGLEARAIVRIEPRNRTTDFEPNYLPFVEFYDEEFPWRYSPARATAQDRLRPWLTLAVLADGEFEENARPGGNLEAITVQDPAAALPEPTELWAWAHVHVNDDLTAGAADSDAVLARLQAVLAEDPDRAYSRLLCPRRLLPDSAYHAFLIPTFETGRLAGLGQEIPAGVDGLAPAWGSAPVALPVYFRWYFRTGSFGDFEHLVSLLRPRVLDPRIGIRDMDVRAPGFGLPGAGPLMLGLEGALRTPDTVSTPWPNPAPFQTALDALLNLSADLSDPGGPDQPLVVPPIYGRWHAATRRVRRLDTPTWVNRLNLDPRHRAAAGLGALVVQRNQERFAEAAWRQVGEVDRANRLLRQSQLSLEAGRSVYRARLRDMAAEHLITVTAPVHGRVLASPTTLRWRMGESRVPLAAVDPAFRRIVRPRGPARRRFGPAPLGPGEVMARINAGEIAAAPPKKPGERQIPVDRFKDEVTPGGLAGALGRLHLRAPWLLPLVLLLLFIAGLLVPLALGGSWALGAVLLVAAVGAAAAAVAARRAAGQLVAAALLDERALVPGRVAAIPTRPSFRVTARSEPAPGLGAIGVDSVEAAHFRAAAERAHAAFAVELEPEPVRAPLDMDAVRRRLLEALDPDTTVSRRLGGMLRVGPPGALAPADRYAPEQVKPILAAPDFPEPLYIPLRDLSTDLLIPNLGLIPRNTISLLETNRTFMEAFMVGANHEMARELLWREYPTDQRGSYFRQFWDVADAPLGAPDLPAREREEHRRDITPIHTWPAASDLGEHAVRTGEESENLVLVIRGDLLKKHPNAAIVATPAVWPADPSTLERELGTEERLPQFSARVGEDIALLGFRLTVEEARGSPSRQDARPGWFFIIKERRGEPRFGLDAAVRAATSTVDAWEDLSWGHLAPDDASFASMRTIRLAGGLHRVAIDPSNNPENAQWATDAAQMAHITLQRPVLVAVHASEMLRLA
jgi:hypothetical protein